MKRLCSFIICIAAVAGISGCAGSQGAIKGVASGVPPFPTTCADPTYFEGALVLDQVIFRDQEKPEIVWLSFKTAGDPTEVFAFWASGWTGDAAEELLRYYPTDHPYLPSTKLPLWDVDGRGKIWKTFVKESQIGPEGITVFFGAWSGNKVDYRQLFLRDGKVAIYWALPDLGTLHRDLDEPK